MPTQSARRCLRPILAAVAITACSAAVAGDVLRETIAAAGLDADKLVAAPTSADGSLSMLGRMRADPLHAAFLAGSIEAALLRRADSPAALAVLASQLFDADVNRLDNAEARADRERLQAAEDPLREALLELAQDFAGAPPDGLPQLAGMARPLRLELGRLLLALGRAEHFRRRALRGLPTGLDRATLLRQGVAGRIGLFERPDLRSALPKLERAALAAGFQEAVAALAALRDFLAQWSGGGTAEWHFDTPLGPVLIDLGHGDDQRRLVAPLLLVDGGGDDRYEFVAAPERPAITLLLDLGGNDSYAALDAAAGPASGLLGYGLLWDAGGGDDHHAGRALDQAAALFGAALLVDEGGNDEYRADSHAQGFALGGLALMLERGGSDRYRALSQAQASAGPAGVALLLEAGGNDGYRLDDLPLVAPSSQLPQINASLGQGAGYGLRGDRVDGRSLAGGLAVLLDAAGDDRYRAGVFAQGAGFWQGGGLLLDLAGADRYQAAWYGQAAAAHRAVGVLLDRGDGDDDYLASHSTSQAAAHDGSVAVLLDEGGDDRYHLGRLGLGSVSDGGVALFAELGGADRYRLEDAGCSAFGAAESALAGSSAELTSGLGLFLDLGGKDDYPAACGRVADDSRWRWPPRDPARRLPSESGAGFDGEAAFPLPTRPGGVR